MIQTQVEISAALEKQRNRLKKPRGQLVAHTGLSYQSLQKILDGTADFKVSSLLAVAAALGLEVALVPRGLGGAVSAAAGVGVGTAESATAFGTEAAPAVAPGIVDAALARLKPLGPS